LFDLGVDLPLGGSPDGLILEGDPALLPIGGIEIKCPQPITHFEWLGSEFVPDEHYAQCQTNMWITEAPWWDFISYNPTFTVARQLLVRRVYPDKIFVEQMLHGCKKISDKVIAEVERRRQLKVIVF
jgi:exodeoxyribonuclease (lambda-induced)